MHQATNFTTRAATWQLNSSIVSYRIVSCCAGCHYDLSDVPFRQITLALVVHETHVVVKICNFQFTHAIWTVKVVTAVSRGVAAVQETSEKCTTAFPEA